MPKPSRLLGILVFATALFAMVACSSTVTPVVNTPFVTQPSVIPPSTQPPSTLPAATPTSSPVPTSTRRPLPTSTPTATPTQLASLPVASSRLTLDPQRLAVIDQNALSASAVTEASVKSLAAYLAAPAQSDLEKARSIYRWITDNISYDFKGYLSKSYGDQSANAVLTRRTAVCAGYANLYEALGKAMGLQVDVVEGWSKGYGYVTNTLDDQPNHAWNAVRLNGTWYLIESTWGAGFINQDKQFTPRFENYYFLVPPQELIYDHFPVDPKWQLLDTPLTKQAFLAAPRVWPEFFENGLGLVSHHEAVIKADSQVDVTVATPQDTLLTASLRKGEVKIPDLFTFVQRQGGMYDVKAAFQQPGRYTLTIFSRKVFESGAYHGTIEYTVDVGQGDPASPGFPVVWDAFFENQIGLVSHPGGILHAAGDLTVILSAPQDVLMLAKVSRQDVDLPDAATFVQRVNGSFEVRAAFPGDGEYQLTIYTKRAGQVGQYHSSLQYLVEVAGASSNSKGFPTTYEAFNTNNVVLYGPFAGVLPLGSTQAFRLAVPGAEKVAVVMGNDWHYLDLKDGVFQGDVKISSADVGVYAKFPGQTQYSGLLKYSSF